MSLKTTQTEKSTVYILQDHESIAYIHRGFGRCSNLCKRCTGLWQLCWTGSDSIQIYHL